MLEVRGLAKSFGAAAPLFDARRPRQSRAASWVAIVGESGSGKSTLLNIVAGLDRARSRRRCASTDAPLDFGDDDALALWRRRHVGFVFQAFHLLPYLTVERERGAAAGAARRGAPPSAPRAPRRRCEAVGLAASRDAPPGLALRRRDAARGDRARPRARARAWCSPTSPRATSTRPTPRAVLDCLRAAVKRAGRRGAHGDALARGGRARPIACCASPAASSLRVNAAVASGSCCAAHSRRTRCGSRSRVACIALGVALGGAVHTIHTSALAEIDRAARALAGQRRPRDPRAAQRFRRRRSSRRSRARPEVAVASPVVELEAPLAERRRHAPRARHRRVPRGAPAARVRRPTRRNDRRRRSVVDAARRDALWLSPAAAARLKLRAGDDAAPRRGTARASSSRSRACSAACRRAASSP